MSHSIPRFRLGAYEPLVELASGGMATVYVARQLGAAGFERLVVLKRVHPHLVKDREFTNMFRDEARLASLVRHSNVVSVIDVVESDNELFLVMDYVESTSVSTLMRSVKRNATRLPAGVASRIVCDVLVGLHAAHEAVDMRGQRLDVVHRDVSPQNIIVGVDGTARLIDFGIAKARNRMTETRTGSIKGKLGYMSPEGAHGQPVDRRADIFSAGVVLFETMTATRLFHGENDLDTLRRIAEAQVPSVCALVSDLPRPIEGILARALARDPNHRFSTALEFLAALERVVPPASAQETAVTVQRFCGPHLETRRQDLRLRLDGKVDSVRILPHDVDSVSSGVLPVSPSLEPGTSQRIATSSDVRAGSGRRSVGPTLAVVMVAIGALLGGLVFFLEGGARRSDAAASASAAASAEPAPVAAAPPPPSASAAAEAPAPVAISIKSDAKIERVEAKGLVRSDVDGKRAKVEIAPWKGDLDVDVVLAGKVGTVHVVAAADGSRDLVANAPKRGGRLEQARPAAQAAPAAAPRQKDELHDNPYGAP